MNTNPEEHKLIDDTFYVAEKKYGLWHSWDKDGKGLVTALTEDSCISGTRFYLKGRQEGFIEPQKVHSGTVDGKL
jgi:hypothetical protein